MGTLADWQIRAACEGWDTHWQPPGGGGAEPIPDPGPLIHPFDEKLLGPASIDMRLGCVFESPQPMSAWVTRDGTRIGEAAAERTATSWCIGEAAVRRAKGDGVEVVLEPGQALACISAEYYRVPPALRGTLYTKSSRAREWINHSTASTVHPGFHGRIAFELLNEGAHPYTVRTGMRVIQIAFERMDAVPEHPYFVSAAAKYRGQIDSVRSADPEGRG